MLFTEVETELKEQMEVVKAAGSCLPWEEVQGAETTQGEQWSDVYVGEQATDRSPAPASI